MVQNGSLQQSSFSAPVRHNFLSFFVHRWGNLKLCVFFYLESKTGSKRNTGSINELKKKELLKLSETSLEAQAANFNHFNRLISCHVKKFLKEV